MRKPLVFILSLLLISSVSAQLVNPIQIPTTQQFYHQGLKIEEVSNVGVVSFLNDNVQHISADDASTLGISSVRHTKISHHFTCQQFYLGIPVFRGQVKLNLDNNGRVLLLSDASYETIHWNEKEIEASISDWVKKLGAMRFRQEARPELVIVVAKSLELHVLLKTYNLEGVKDEIVLTNIAGDEVLRIDERVNHNPTQSEGSGLVFNPDPVTASGNLYGGDIVDGGDENTSVDEYRVSKTFFTAFDGSVHRLISPQFNLLNMGAPNDQPPTSTSGEFNYSRTEPGFEFVNAYYHLNAMFGLISDLGYSDLHKSQLNVDPRSGMEDNSFFSPNQSPQRLLFGIGGVDDAEDADVVVHEYGHAMSYFAAPNTNVGHFRNAIDESLGDYFAATYSKRINEYNWENTYSWDGHNEYWSGRVANSHKKIEDTVQSNFKQKAHIYPDSEIMTAAMTDMWEVTGQENADRLVLCAMHFVSANMSFQDMAQSLLLCNELQNEGENQYDLKLKFFTRGLVDTLGSISRENENTVYGTEDFSFGRSDQLFIVFDKEADISKVSLFDVSGRLHGTWSNITESVFALNRSMFASSGVYLIMIENAGGISAHKVILINN